MTTKKPLEGPPGSATGPVYGFVNVYANGYGPIWADEQSARGAAADGIDCRLSHQALEFYIRTARIGEADDEVQALRRVEKAAREAYQKAPIIHGSAPWWVELGKALSEYGDVERRPS